jgi:L-threonylcarbamoyladenylate synthase
MKKTPDKKNKAASVSAAPKGGKVRKKRVNSAPPTKILKPDEVNVTVCADEIKKGGVVAFPTETVYGLGASVFDPLAVQRIFDAKGRPQDNPLIVHVSSFWQIKQLVLSMPEKAVKLAKKYMPGPITLILKKRPLVPDAVTAGLDTVAVRMPKNNIALELIEKAGVPIAAPSANRSGTPSPTTAKHVLHDLNGRIPYILDGGQCLIGVESTVVDLTSDPPAVLRVGAIPVENIEKTIGKLAFPLSGGKEAKDTVPLSPGMKYRHYAPKARVLFSAFHDGMFEVMKSAYDVFAAEKHRPIILALDKSKKNFDGYDVIALGKDYDEYARKLYAALRHADALKYDTVIAEGVPATGIGATIVNRLVKASEGNII